MSHQRDIKEAALEGINDTPEDISNKAKGHKANLSNPSMYLGYLANPFSQKSSY
jgi:hypothetical protein